jgi:N6-L-threonylcarbamoyladenine synthase
VDAIAVTYGPGLEPCLWVGINFARALSFYWNIPLISVNHIEAHILVNYLQNPKIALPAMALVVSGGHTQLILMEKIGKYKIIGETRDDAAGECFDKCAKLLGLGYPGGPIISKMATEQKISNIELPRPMMNSKDYDFSFSGLKTAVLYKVRDLKVDDSFVKNMATAVQNAIVDVLVKKTLQAAKDYKVKSIILGGGVSANLSLRAKFAKQSEISVIFPEPKLSTDNGLMIAVAGYFNRTKKIAWQKLSANANLRLNE